MTDAAPSLYVRAGGAEFFDHLVAAFYRGVATDDVLAPLYPDYPDFGPAERRLSLFLQQYWGGPTTYLDERGHPRLRMRHAPFRIGPLERDRWLVHMAAAVDEACTELAGTTDLDTANQVAGELMAYFVPVAEQMRNDTGLPITSANYPRTP